MFYVVCMVFGVVKKLMLDVGIVIFEEFGIMGLVFFFIYVFGKFLNGFLFDYVNIGCFMLFLLLLLGVVLIFMGMNMVVFFFVLLWGLNGWF